MINLAIIAGGTGGHIYPAIAVAKEISKKSKNVNIYFICRKNGREVEIIESENFKHIEITISPLSISFSINILIALYRFLFSFFQCFFIIYKIKPNIVFGLGNYISVPFVISSYLCGIPIVIHEQNIIPGRATKLLSYFSKKIFVSFEDTKKYFPDKKVIFTGNPVREINSLSKEEIGKQFGIDINKKIILFFGGSLGAKTINDLVIKSQDLFSKKDNYCIVHITGTRDYNYVIQNIKDFKNYKVFSYLDNLLDIMKIADIVICRAGATTIAEITYLGKVSILIPYPKAVANHQEKNARILEKNNAAIVIKEQDLSPEKIFFIIEEILQNKEKFENISKASFSLSKRDAKEKIIDEIFTKMRIY